MTLSCVSEERRKESRIDLSGLEPTLPTLQPGCATNCTTDPCLHTLNLEHLFNINSGLISSHHFLLKDQLNITYSSKVIGKLTEEPYSIT